jgi:hypothetical protein
MKFEVGLIANFYGVDGNYFKLGATVFHAEEDESDGYRSMMREVKPVKRTKEMVFFARPIAKVRVGEAHGRLRSSSGNFDGYQLIDMQDHHLWLLLGTDNSDDYYPSFTFMYTPKAPANVEPKP